MISDRSRRRLAWAAPVVVAAAIATTVVVSTTSASGASPTLPRRSVADLLTAVRTKAATVYSGQLTETAALGIPSLPGGHSGASLSPQTLLAGSHSAKVWVDGAARQRIALVGELSEADVVHDGNQLWTYTSDTNTVTHATLPAHAAQHPTRQPSATDLTPGAVSARLLKAITPSTSVSLDTTVRVADRDAYLLVLRPRDARSTVNRVTIAIDATSYLPLRVQIFGRGSSPAFSTGFTSIYYTRPAASTFDFHPPAGATTSNDPLRLHGDRHHRTEVSRTPRSAAGAARPTVIGSGWTSVLELSGSDVAGLGGSTLQDLSTAVGSTGTRLVHTALVNAVILPDGRTFVGAVTPALLEHVASSTPH